MNMITQACEMNKVKLELKSGFLPVLIKVRKMTTDSWSSNRIVSVLNIIVQSCKMNKIQLELKPDHLPVVIKVHKMNNR